MPANCINTNRTPRKGARGGFTTRLSEARESENGKCERSVRSRKPILPGGYTSWYIERGNKFRQIVLPALYTVAHEVERSVLSGHPSAIGRGYPPTAPSLAFDSTSHCGYVHPGYCGRRRHAPCAPGERKRCHFLRAIFLTLRQNVRFFPILPFPSPPLLASSLRYQPPFLYSANVFPIFLLRSTCAPIAGPFRRTCMQ